jgi:hypothetical protein
MLLPALGLLLDHHAIPLDCRLVAAIHGGWLAGRVVMMLRPGCSGW